MSTATLVLDQGYEESTTDAETATLDQLVQRIKEEHQEFQRKMYDSLTHARTAGELLIEVKKQMQHGDWGSWVEENCGFSWSTANRYMKVAREWEMLPEDSRRVGNLSLRQAEELLYGQKSAKRWGRSGGAAIPRHAHSCVKAIQQFLVALERAAKTPEGIRDSADFVRTKLEQARAAIARLEAVLP